MRHATTVRFDWLETYLQRVEDVDLKRLSQGKISYHADRWKRAADHVRAKKTKAMTKAIVEPMKPASVTSNTMTTAEKVAAAKARFAARKKK